MKTRRGLRLLSFMLAFIVAFNLNGTIVKNAWAASGTQIKITKNKQIVDTYNGVSAYYRPGVGDGADETYGCYAYVVRYYKAIYGKTVYNLFHKCTPLTYGDSFKVVSKPKVGDICAQIKANTNHWSIVRKVNGDKVTVIDQNNKWVVGDDTYAYKNYTYDVSEVTFYRLASVIDGTATTEKAKATSEKAKVGTTEKATTTEKAKATTEKAKATTEKAKATTEKAKATTEKAKATTEKAKATTEKAKATVETSTEATVSMSIVEGNQKTITKKVVPALSKTSAFKWSTSKKTIAKVTNKGLVTGVKKGSAVITGSLKTGKTVKVKVNVKASKKLKLVSEDVTIPMNYKWKITSSEKDVTFTYESSDTSIATVNKNGEIKSKKKRGNTTITVTASNGKKGTCIVRVY